MALDWLTVTMTATNMACYWYIDSTFLNFFEIGRIFLKSGIIIIITIIIMMFLFKNLNALTMA